MSQDKVIEIVKQLQATNPEIQRQLDEIIQIYNDLRQQTLKYIEFQDRQLIQFFSNVAYLGPLSLFKAECMSVGKSRDVERIRHNYEMLLGTADLSQQEDHKYIQKIKRFYEAYAIKFSEHFISEFQDEPYRKFLEDLTIQESINSIQKSEWQSKLGELIDIPTFQEIIQTQVEFQSEGSEKKNTYNYDGDEERTPIQSEQEIQEKCNKYAKKQKERQEEEQDGYDASNSDHSKTKSKTRNIRIQRRKNQNPNTEFDTDRERNNKE